MTGQYQMGSRTYDPARATFLTPDTYRASQPQADLSVGVDPLTMNRYAYVNGDPVNFIDPDGHGLCNPFDADCRRRAKEAPLGAASAVADAGEAVVDKAADLGGEAVDFVERNAETIGKVATVVGLVLADKGRVRLDPSPADWIDRQLGAMPMRRRR